MPDENANQSCHRKNRYLTETEAEAKARDAWRKRRHKVRVYFCEFCLGWHLTHKTKRGEAA